MHNGRIVMRDDADTVIEAYKEFLQVGESEVIDEDV